MTDTRRRTRLLVVSTDLGSGGAGRFASCLLAETDQQAIEPIAAVMCDRIRYEVPAAISVHTLGGRKPWQLPAVARRLRSLIKHIQPDVVLSVIAGASRVTGLALAGLQPRPRWIVRIGSEPGIRWLVDRNCYRQADLFVPNSQALVASSERSYPYARGRMEFITNAAQFDLLDARAAEPPPIAVPQDRPIVLAVNGLNRQKRPDVLVDAFAMVARRSAAELWICGDGAWRKRTEKQIARLNLADRVRLLGFCSNPFALLKQATLFTLTSDRDGMPNALIEAQALGVPAVATRAAGGVAEIVDDGVTGLLAPCGDAAAVGRAIQDLLDDPDRRGAMAVAARKSARTRFAPEPIYGAWNTLIQSVASPVGKAA